MDSGSVDNGDISRGKAQKEDDKFKVVIVTYGIHHHDDDVIQYIYKILLGKLYTLI